LVHCPRVHCSRGHCPRVHCPRVHCPQVHRPPVRRAQAWTVLKPTSPTGTRASRGSLERIVWMERDTRHFFCNGACPSPGPGAGPGERQPRRRAGGLCRDTLLAARTVPLGVITVGCPARPENTTVDTCGKPRNQPGRPRVRPRLDRQKQRVSMRSYSAGKYSTGLGRSLMQINQAGRTGYYVGA